MPVFYYSSSLDLGYSYNWIRPPAEVYNLFTTSLEGMSVDYDISLGDWYGTVTGYYGETSGVDPETKSIVEFDSILGGIVALERGNLTLRGSYSTDDNVSIVRTYFNGATYVTEPFELPLTFASGSVIYDNGTLMLGSEVTSTKFKNNLNNDESSWYVTGGLRLGSFTPHLTYSSFKQKPTAADSSLVVVPGVGVLKISDYPQDISAITAGIRWDFDIAAAIKVEYTTRTDNTEEPANLEGQWSPFGDAQVVSVSVDVVF